MVVWSVHNFESKWIRFNVQHSHSIFHSFFLKLYLYFEDKKMALRSNKGLVEHKSRAFHTFLDNCL